MTERLEAEGSRRGSNSKWDDKSDHDDVTKIYVNYSLSGIESIRFDYVKSGKPKDGPFRGQSYNTYTHTFEINHLKYEHLESVEGYYTEDTGIEALQFKTNLRISEPIGYHHDGCTKFILAVEGKKIIGFHGSSFALRVGSLGAYFTWDTPTIIKAVGGKVGTKWDDGVNQAGFTKIHVRSGQKGIQFIKLEYVDKDGNLTDGPIHGSIYRRGSPHVFEFKHDEEYLVSVEGYYEGDEECEVIQGLQFRTNIKTSELMGSNTGKKFKLTASGMKIVGFHGYAEKNLSSLGAYLTPLTPKKSECKGITDGSNVWNWDDGAFEGIRKVSVFFTALRIRCLMINYEDAGKVVKRSHGLNNNDHQEEKFVVDYPNEFITSVVGTMSSSSVMPLIFKTSKGRTSKQFGDYSFDDSVEFVLESKGCAIVGFHGWHNPVSGYMTALGAYYYPMPLPPAAEKLEAQGGAGGAPWDDGSNFQGVRKIYIGTGEVGIVSIKFLYENDVHEIVVGDHHGNKNLLRHEEFDLDYPSEYLTSVEGSYDVVPGSEEYEVIIMLKFTTNKRTSPCYGLDDDPIFVLHKEGHKIVGFHGKSSNMLHKLGIHVLPISNS